MVYGHLKTRLGPVTGKYVRFYQRPGAASALDLRARTKSLAPTGWYSTTVRPRRSTTYKAVSFADTYRVGGDLEPRHGPHALYLAVATATGSGRPVLRPRA